MPPTILSTMRRTLAGDLAFFGGPKTDEQTAARLRAHQIDPVIRNTPGLMLANVCNALILVLAFWDTANRLPSCLWALVLVSLVGANYIRRILRPVRSRSTVSAAAVHRVVLHALLLGGLWSAVPILFFNESSAAGQVIVACLTSGMLGGGAFGLASIPIAAIAFTSPMLLGSAVALSQSGDSSYLLVGCLMAVYWLALLRIVIAHAIQNVTSLIAKFDVEQRVRVDPLTQLPNRIWFQESLALAFARLNREHEQFALFCFDLDNFKAVNDSFGHSAGDELLAQVADRVRKRTRSGDTLARLGGDEFAIVAGRTTTPQEASAIADRIISAFDKSFLVDGHEIRSTASIGIAMAPADGIDSRELLRSADIALYRAKGAPGGSYQFFEPRHDAKARERRAFENDLAIALKRQEFRLVYQPVLSLKSNRIVAAEALLRWHHPVRGTLLPAEFLPTAEATGLIRAVGDWVVKEACTAAASWPDDIRVAVNFSASQFREASTFSVILRALEASGLAPRRLEIEITETVLLSEDEAALELLRTLARAGISLALDDFGTGYSSLSYLRKLPFRRIKIDRSFVHDLRSNSDSASIVRSIIGLASDLRIGTVAEGVEDEGQLEFLRSSGCEEAQGYFISAPQSTDDITALLLRQPAMRAA